MCVNTNVCRVSKYSTWGVYAPKYHPLKMERNCESIVFIQIVPNPFDMHELSL
jgi:hypothetical protein